MVSSIILVHSLGVLGMMVNAKLDLPRLSWPIWSSTPATSSRTSSPSASPWPCTRPSRTCWSAGSGADQTPSAAVSNHLPSGRRRCAVAVDGRPEPKTLLAGRHAGPDGTADRRDRRQRLGQVHPAAAAQRPRGQPSVGTVTRGRRRYRPGGAGGPPAGGLRLHRSALPAGHAHRARGCGTVAAALGPERHGTPAPGRGRAGPVRAAARWRTRASTSSPAANASSWRWPPSWPWTRRCWCWTSRPPCWTCATANCCAAPWPGSSQQIIMSTHDLDLALDMDRVLVVEAGRVVFDGGPAAAVEPYRALCAGRAGARRWRGPRLPARQLRPRQFPHPPGAAVR